MEVAITHALAQERTTTATNLGVSIRRVLPTMLLDAATKRLEECVAWAPLEVAFALGKGNLWVDVRIIQFQIRPTAEANE